MWNAWGRSIIHIGFWWENQKEREHQEDLELGGWIIIKWILDGMG
jgi:hypothetical protein